MKKIQGKAVDKPLLPSIVESSADRSRSRPSSTLTLAFEDCNPFVPSHNTVIEVEMKGILTELSYAPYLTKFFVLIVKVTNKTMN